MRNITRRTFGSLAAGGVASTALPAWAVAPEGWRLGFQTPAAALDSELERLSGKLPADLEGVLYRAGPAQFERAGERLGHWFDGDGMLQRFAVAGGKVRHRGRFVATDKRIAEEAAGHFLYFGYGFTPRASVAVRRLDDLNAANTSVMPVGDEIWALWEGGSPWRVHPTDLSTLGRQKFSADFDGLPFSAHPKKGPDGDIWNFGAIGGRCIIWRLAPDGTVRSGAVIELPAASLMHDFAVTRTKVVLVLPPLLASGANGPALIDRYSWRADEPLRIVILEKDDLTRQRVIELPARFLFHIGNAWEDAAGDIRLDACLLEDSSFASVGTRDLALGRYADHLTARPTLITARADGSGGLESLSGVGEFPRIDPRRVGERHNITYGIIEFGIAAWNWDTGHTTSSAFSQSHWSEEPVFVPRPDRSGEQDGWLITTTLNTLEQRTELAVFEASRIADGPIAMFGCPYVVPLGFHGAFVSTS